ncbi:hypothetical protein C8R47DRAFT_65242 [Mycena vitilis]|nr:hypothetical protein C8R47DRAFT_65242 [Mycena vitilis]
MYCFVPSVQPNTSCCLEVDSKFGRQRCGHVLYCPSCCPYLFSFATTTTTAATPPLLQNLSTPFSVNQHGHNGGKSSSVSTCDRWPQRKHRTNGGEDQAVGGGEPPEEEGFGRECTVRQLRRSVRYQFECHYQSRRCSLPVWDFSVTEYPQSTCRPAETASRGDRARQGQSRTSKAQVKLKSKVRHSINRSHISMEFGLRMRRKELWPESDPQALIWYISDDEDEDSGTSKSGERTATRLGIITNHS